MKLKFKQQPYQADATMAVVRCFEGQGKSFRKEIVGRETFDNGLFGTELTRVEEIFSKRSSKSPILISCGMYKPPKKSRV